MKSIEKQIIKFIQNHPGINKKKISPDFDMAKSGLDGDDAVEFFRNIEKNLI